MVQMVAKVETNAAAIVVAGANAGPRKAGTAVDFEAVDKRFPDGTTAVRALSLSVAQGEFLVLVGPSGCGKSTVLRLAAGLEQPSAGRVLFDGRDVSMAGPQARNIAMVFQSYALYPHMTVAENLGFPLRMRGLPRAAIDAKVRETAAMLDLTALLGRRPGALSGGQRQRVAMGRALVREPGVFLMDEPLSNLDARLRVQLRADIGALQRRLGITTLYVTHDQVEALTLGERVAVLRAGVLQQVASPRELYAAPANIFVASFIGQPGMNLLPVHAAARSARQAVSIGDQQVSISGIPLAGDTPHFLGVRPEALELVRTDAAAESADRVRLAARVIGTELLGHEQWVHLQLDGIAANPAHEVQPLLDLGLTPGRITLRQTATQFARTGETVHVGIDARQIHGFDATGQAVRRPT